MNKKKKIKQEKIKTTKENMLECGDYFYFTSVEEDIEDFRSSLGSSNLRNSYEDSEGTWESFYKA